MRKLIIIAASLAALAIPTAAMASVAVDANGSGFVGKGDVQTALDLDNDAAMQDLFKKGEIKFTAASSIATDNTLACIKYDPTVPFPASPFVPTGDVIHKIFTTATTQAVKAEANTNAAGKLTNGWNLTGIDSAITYGATTVEQIGTCPSGTSTKTINQVYTESSAHGLKVTGNGVTVDLPNTPVVLPAA
jgi:hypothetical protein